MTSQLVAAQINEVVVQRFAVVTLSFFIVHKGNEWGAEWSWRQCWRDFLTWQTLNTSQESSSTAKHHTSECGTEQRYWPPLSLETFKTCVSCSQFSSLSHVSLFSQQRKVRERSSSESSLVERGEGADTPDSNHRLTPNLGNKSAHSSPHLPSYRTAGTPNQVTHDDNPPEDKIRLPFPSSSKPLTLPSINGEFGSEDSTLWVHSLTSYFN